MQGKNPSQLTRTHTRSTATTICTIITLTPRTAKGCSSQRVTEDQGPTCIVTCSVKRPTLVSRIDIPSYFGEAMTN